ncbi:hypothetical protein [Pendulispora albinea]|uniref:Uncharacterized protein n=1 Tax=Pendulispora albinea TaxID=2741071 RepID=A0ABZ2MBW0_9BACT
MNDPNQRIGVPYVPSHAVEAPRPPSIWRWYIAYAACMALLYIGVTAMGAIGSSGQNGAGEGVRWIFLVTGPLLTVAYGIAPFLPKKPWAWTYHVVLIGMGLTSLCCLPVTLPLLLQWLKPEAKSFFGRN